LILHTRNGGTQWEAQRQGSPGLNAIAFSDERHGWAVGEQGTILRTDDGGQHWCPAARPSAKRAFPNPRSGVYQWILGGRSITIQDDAAIGVVDPKEITHNAVGIYLSTPDHGWVWLENGTVVETEDHGRTWSTLDDHRVWIAPWYLFSFFPIALLIYAGTRKPPPAGVIEASVASLAVSDRPIGPDDPDPLRFGELARGISRFLRNRKTEPPITVAITGLWGRGKSSLMNLLRADLELHGLKPIWFNAWHHQEEENLLAAILQAVRIEATPHILSPFGIPFRLKLLLRRLEREWFRFLFIAAVFALSLGYVLTYPQEVWTITLSTFKNAPEEALKDPFEFILKVLGPSLGIFGGAGFFLRAIRAFGLNPADLLATKTGNQKTKALESQTSFRIRFAQEFKAVSQALRPRTLTMFIDDLDRCSPENVLKVLEAVNFLVSSGPCVVVLGLDLDYVKTAVRNVLQKQIGDEYADKYLEKLVNLAVPVPDPPGDRLDQFITTAADPTSFRTEEDTDEKYRRRFSQIRTIFLVASSLAFLCGTVWLGTHLPAPPKKEEEERKEARSAAKAEVQAPEGLGNRLADPFAPNEASEFNAAPVKELNSIYFYVLLGLLCCTVIAGCFIRGDAESDDSPRFREALQAWNPLLIRNPQKTDAPSTPRTMKRVLNKVRYLAMLQRKSPPAPELLLRIARWISSIIGSAKPRASEEYLAKGAMDEENLVGLHILNYWNPKWIENFPSYDEFIKFVRSLPGADKSPKEIERLVAFVTPERWAAMKSCIPKFRELGSAVQLA
jgi:hypothetical protein